MDTSKDAGKNLWPEATRQPATPQERSIGYAEPGDKRHASEDHVEAVAQKAKAELAQYNLCVRAQQHATVIDLLLRGTDNEAMRETALQVAMYLLHEFGGGK